MLSRVHGTGSIITGLVRESYHLKMYSLSKREVRNIGDQINSNWPPHNRWNIKNLKAVDAEKHGRLLVGEELTMIERKDAFVIPHLTEDVILSTFPFVVVDMGAVGFICNGANVMRPGITHFEKFAESEILVIKDQMHEKKLAVGISRLDSEKMKAIGKGPVITNLHYVGDIFWNLKKGLRK
jgi:PUA domain protein